MGMWESQSQYFAHACTVGHRYSPFWQCYELGSSKGILMLKLSIPQCCNDDEYEVQVQSCPFCGYTPKEIP